MFSKKADVISYVKPRWYPILAGLLTSTICGMFLYAFSVFINPISVECGWSCSEVALGFSIACFCNGITAFFAGRLTDKFGPRYVVIFGSILVGVGYFLTSFVKMPLHLYMSFGVMAGIGSGFIYLPPIVTAPKWWPDRPALATGFVVSGLGLGAAFMGPVASKIIIFYGWREVFFIFGIIMTIMGIIAGFLLSNPPANFKLSEKFKKNKNVNIKLLSISYLEAIKTKQFWLLYLSYFFAATAGLMVIGHIAAHGENQGLSPMKAAYAVTFFSIFNAFTRILSGLIVDKIKLKIYFTILLGLQSIAMLLLYPSGSNLLFLCFVSSVIGWNFGAMFMLFPTITLKFFGQKEQGSIYGLLFTSYGLAGLLGAWFGGYVKDVIGTYWVAFLVSSIIVGLSSLIIGTLKPISK